MQGNGGTGEIGKYAVLGSSALAQYKLEERLCVT